MSQESLATFEGPFYRQEGRVGMYQVLLPYLTFGKPMLRYMPASYGESYGWLQDNYVKAVFLEKDFERVTSEILTLSQDGFPEAWQKRWKEIDRELTSNAQRFVSMDLALLSLENLQKEYEKMHAIDEDMWMLSIFIDAFDAGYDQREIERISARYGLSPHEAHVLTTPLAPSYITEVETLISSAMAEGDLTELVERFFWYGTNYSEFEEVEDEFFRRIGAELHGTEFVSPEIEEKRILAAAGLSANPLAFFRTLTAWRDERKRLNYTGLYVLVKILREVARRQRIEPLLINALVPYQVSDFFAGKVSQDTLEQQFHHGVLFHVTPEGEFEYFFGEDGKIRWEEVEAATALTEIASEVKGTVASKGKAVGPARIVMDFSGPQAKEFQKGDILVTSMTRPEFLPLMKLSGAIVTNEGGITSHAAIVSRELRIPCIIGTKNATQVFKDGDMIEVDADSGIVRKI